jgi:N-ethylmaleimide reductase
MQYSIKKIDYVNPDGTVLVMKVQSSANRADSLAQQLFEPYRFGVWALANRIVMAPLTRNRATLGNVSSSLAVKYYAQRASAGLVITEATQVSPQGQGYEATPGIHSPAQVEGWRDVAGRYTRGEATSFCSFGTAVESHTYRCSQEEGLRSLPLPFAQGPRLLLAVNSSRCRKPRALRIDEIQLSCRSVSAATGLCRKRHR